MVKKFKKKIQGTHTNTQIAHPRGEKLGTIEEDCELQGCDEAISKGIGHLI